MEALGALGVGLAILLETLVPPIPSEVVLPLAGYLAQTGRMGLVAAFLAATAGSLLGAAFLYQIGRWLGPSAAGGGWTGCRWSTPPTWTRPSGPSSAAVAPPSWSVGWCRWCAASSPCRPAWSACRGRSSCSTPRSAAHCGTAP